jgi:hypothetical protein
MAEYGHALLVPDDPVGVVAFLDARRHPEWASPEPGSFDAEALAHGLAILHVTTGNPLDFLFAEEDLRTLTRRVERVLTDNGLSHLPVHVAGLSLGGTRALRFIIFLKRSGGEWRLKPGAAAIVDAPLDMERLWRSEGQAISRDYHPAAADEGRWVRYLLEANLGGSPEAARESYVSYSPYAYTEPGGGNARYLCDTPLRAYHEPDIDWWLKNRRKSYYDMNSLDMAALVVELTSCGNEEARLVSTHGSREGYEAGSSPHTWSIVDNRELAQWFQGISSR